MNRKTLAAVIIMSIVVVCSAQFAGGNGTEADPWRIETAVHLNNVRNYLGAQHNDKHFVQTANINLGVPPWNEEEGWLPIGTSYDNSFRGSYDGGRYIISSLTINRPEMSYLGLFAFTYGAVINNVGLVDVDINGYSSVAALIGLQANTSVSRCFVTGNISGHSTVAGISAYLFEFGNTIFDCYSNAFISTSVVNARHTAGGITAMNEMGEVRRCYATGRIETAIESSGVGAVVGTNGMGTLSHLYWNSETTGQSRGVGSEDEFPGNTTLELLRAETYDGFDFDDIWRIDEGNSFPYLSWQGDEPSDHNLPPLLPPVNLSGFGGDTTINLFWEAPNPQMGVPDGYIVYRNDVRVNDEPVEGLQFQDTGLTNWTSYYYRVTAFYEDEESFPSTPIKLTAVLFAGGNGSEDEPYLVETAEQLDNIRLIPHFHFRQVADIDLNQPPYNEEEGWLSIGSERDDERFRGTYDGNGFVISDLMIERPDSNYQGLFGYIENALIINTHLENIDIIAARYIGGITGFQDKTRIINSSVSGTIHSSIEARDSDTGGLVGYQRWGDEETNAIIECRADVQVSGGNQVGGIVGNNWHGNIVDCIAEGRVSGNHHVGGIAGYARGQIINCAALITITATGNNTGGLTGRNNELIYASYSLGSITSNGDYAGGISGYSSGLGVQSGRIIDCYSTVSVTGVEHVGGLLGRNHEGEVRYSYAAGRVQGESDVGGLIGSNSGEVNDSYWDIEATGQNNSAGGEGRLTRQMVYPYDAQTYIDWDFIETWRDDPQSLVNEGYPYLAWQHIDVSPNPDIAVNPQPRNDADSVSVSLDRLAWSYVESVLYTNPAGFRIYFSTTDEFDDDEFLWVQYVDEQENYHADEILPENLEYFTQYYWKVVPTTIEPDLRGKGQGAGGEEHRGRLLYRGDAQDVPVWRFRTELNPQPVAAVNPVPADSLTDVTLDLESLKWEYFADSSHVNPVGFRVYFNDTGDFDEDEDFVWVPFTEGEENYSTSEPLPDELVGFTTYYWKVVPTANEPDGLRAESRERRAESEGQGAGDEELRSIVRTRQSLPVQQTAGLLSVTSEPSVVQAQEQAVVQNRERPSPGEVKRLTLLNKNCENECNLKRRLFNRASGVNRPFYKHRSRPLYRGDAQNVPVWSFTTIDPTNIEADDSVPYVTELHGNYPNPFNPETIIGFTLAEAGTVRITIFNIKGQKVSTLVNSVMEAGSHQVIWNGRDDNNREVGGGVYLYRMITGDYTASGKMILLK